ncbi:MAG: LacI family DNA-binding transcriptional regulator [Bacteroidota bacterium]
MANMKDVARATGVSLATVSRVFNESEKVRPATRKKVLTMAEKLNYRPNKIAAGLRKGKSGSVGVIIPVIDREVFSSSIKSMEEVLSQAGYNVIICQSHESVEKEAQIIENLKQLRIDGVVISISKETKRIDHLTSLQQDDIPVIFFDRDVELAKFNSVVINNYNGAYQATSHLIDQGCQRIVHLAGNENVFIFKERKRGFVAALRDMKMEMGPQSNIPFDDGHREGVDQLRQLLQSDSPPDGILANGDIAALVALRVVEELGLKIPADLAIVGFGDSNFCTYLRPSLSSVNQRNEDIGKMAANLLLSEINKEAGEFIGTQQMLPPVLKIRDSSNRLG